MAGNLLQRYLALLRAQMTAGDGGDDGEGDDDDDDVVFEPEDDEEDVQVKPETQTAIKSAAESPLLVCISVSHSLTRLRCCLRAPLTPHLC